MKCIHLIPDGVDAVEIINFGNLDVDNNLAKVYAEAYDLPMTAGSDAHNFGDIRDFVVGTETPIESVADYIECIKQGSLQLPCLS